MRFISWKVIGLILGIVILTASVGIGVYLTQKQQRTKVGATGATLTLTTSSANPKAGDTFVVAVSINTQGASATGADLKIKYNSNLLTATSITAGGFLPTVFITGSVATPGTASIVLGCLVDSSGPHPATGSGLLAQITFKAKAPGVSSITFDPATIVAVSGQTTNAAGLLTPVQITVVSPPTPTPTPTKTPSPTPSPTPTNSPSPSPTPTPTPTPKLGDINGDSVIDIVDIGVIVDNYDLSPLPNLKCDLNGDGIANIVDIGIVIDHYSQ